VATRDSIRDNGIRVLRREVMAEGTSAWERATHFGAGHHGIHVLGREAMAEASSSWERARNFGAAPAVRLLLSRQYWC
jgi:hypothetical protein